ncbi:mitochondrial import inner membrane translocase subunit TIM50-C-like [Condylostylus longicornis]|uniref:mitochondrial import inner membrane translocase subunit TIM50-C-like n=1 Tax=Condylostylus longicornis TaxID=2530218 RepID=UPI00244DFE69|nr:mitochondrial import inner membrane translocase subunit TIM50-C-like [Condylostylus longicornis]
MLHINLLRTAKQLRYAKSQTKLFCKLFQLTEESPVLTPRRCLFVQHGVYAADSTKSHEASPQIISKLFPQTAPENVEQGAGQENKEDEKNKEQSNRKMKLMFGLFGGAMTAMSLWTIYEFGRPEVDASGKEIEDEFSKEPIIQQYLKRMWKSLTYYQKMIQEPSREKLLPDPLKPPYIQPPYTLVLEMKDVLVHPDWTYQTGWRFKKRPGVDYFLEQTAKHFEIVVFTAGQGMAVFPILDALDPNGYIMYRLVRDATHFVDGHHVKNLDNLNRDLKRVIVIDWDPNTTKFHPQNAFSIARWHGNDNDTALFDLVSFLKTLATAEVDDVREVLEYYKQFDDPLLQFRENQKKLQEQITKQEKEEQLKQKPIVKRWTPSFMSRS